MSLKEIKREEEYGGLHKKLIEKTISVIKPLSVLNKINKESLEGKGEVFKQSFNYVENFNLRWTEWSIVEQSGYRAAHELAIVFYHFIFEPKGITFPGFVVVVGGGKTKSIEEDWQNLEVKDISSFDKKTSTVFKIPTRLGKIKANFKEIKPLFDQAIRKAYSNSALKV